MEAACLSRALCTRRNSALNISVQCNQDVIYNALTLTPGGFRLSLGIKLFTRRLLLNNLAGITLRD